MKEQKGITLVALVITIIVLLILAGVTIAALSGQNGILTNASTAQKNTAVSEVREALAMAINTIYTNKYAGATEDADMDEDTKTWIMKYEGEKIQLPDKFFPDEQFIEYHNDVIFQH